MKRIIKGQEPASFIQFKQENERSGVRIRYDENLGSAQRTPLKRALLSEQGFLCAYTLKRICVETCHIEHVKPETLCRQHMAEGRETVSDLDYSNMVACFPKELPKGIPNHKYFGAIKKENYWENDGADYILPFQDNCEDHFKYDKSGGVKSLSDKGRNTISLLGLDHQILTHDRKNAIQNFIGKAKPIKKAKTIQAISDIDKLENGKFIEFCIPIKHALKEHLAYLEKVERKIKFVRRK